MHLVALNQTDHAEHDINDATYAIWILLDAQMVAIASPALFPMQPIDLIGVRMQAKD